MLKIVVLDDNQNICAHLKTDIESYLNQIKEEFTINVFSSTESFLNYLNTNQDIDILFLDIEIDEISGINVANIIRNHFDNEHTKIIFISAHQNYAMELFKVRPIDFLVKPIQKVNLHNVLDTSIKLIFKDKSIFKYKIRNEIFSEHIKNIIFFESMGRKIKITTTKGQSTFYGSLKKIAKQLENFDFIQTHNSFLVNHSYISKVCKNEVILNIGTPIPISRAKKDNILNLYIEG